MVYHVLSDIEQRLVDTDSAMLELDPEHEGDLVEHYNALHAAGHGPAVIDPTGTHLTTTTATAAAAGEPERGGEGRYERPPSRPRAPRVGGGRRRVSRSGRGRRGVRVAAGLDCRRARGHTDRSWPGSGQAQRRRHRDRPIAQPPR